ncbi:hypothetical protein HYZ78_03770 [Candidatus Microgenomates bacterium]|nr:hypothetical protein [Candidatus Microgenomates bacterium]
MVIITYMFPFKKKQELEQVVRDPRTGLPVIKPKPKKVTKPWGKKERYLVATILAVTIIASLVAFIGSQGFSLPELYLPDISTDRTIEIEK